MTSHHRFSSLDAFGIDTELGFLPRIDPLATLPRAFESWEWLAGMLPKLLVMGRVREEIRNLSPFPITALRNERQCRRALQLLSYLGQAYVWGEPDAADSLPRVLAMPWHAVAAGMERPPILSYASYALDNWFRLDEQGPVRLGNIALIQNFLGGRDEEWFILIHVDIEARAGEAIRALRPAQDAVVAADPKRLRQHLTSIRDALAGMYATLERMTEHCDPYIYYHRVRPYIHGWKNHPALPHGVTYEGVRAYRGKPQLFRGETGAQSTIVPVLDAFLGIAHEDDPLRVYLMEMREYMPAGHRRFLEVIEQGPSVRNYLTRPSMALQPLVELYDECVDWVERFRSLHLKYAASYIFKQSYASANNPHAVGTGGTPFMQYLKKHRDETSRHVMGEPLARDARRQKVSA